MTDRLAAELHTRWLAMAADVRRRERGLMSIEAVLYALAIIAVAGIVLAAITNFVTTRANQIGP